MPEATNAERGLVFRCAGEELVGILHPAPGATGVVIVVGGPQYRVGSHRQFLLLARRLAASGIPVHCYVTRIAVANTEDTTEFEQELQEHAPPLPEVAAIPLRFII